MAHQEADAAKKAQRTHHHRHRLPVQVVGRFIDAQEITLAMEGPADLGALALTVAEGLPSLKIITTDRQLTVQLAGKRIPRIGEVIVGGRRIIGALTHIHRRCGTQHPARKRLLDARRQHEQGALAPTVGPDDGGPAGREDEVEV